MTPLIKFYLDLGLQVTNVTKFIQYKAGKSLAPFASKVYRMRCEATYQNDESKATTAKLFGNSGYGKCAEDVEKHSKLKVVFEADKLDKLQRSALCTSEHSIIDEDGEEVAHEVRMLKAKITDDKPLLYGLAILQWSKILFLRLV